VGSWWGWGLVGGVVGGVGGGVGGVGVVWGWRTVGAINCVRGFKSEE